jgi:leader peptidase (prepilin peptidase)/N-methyltransferase
MPFALHVVLAAALTWLSWVDIRTYRLPDVGTLSLVGLGLLAAWTTSGATGFLNSLASACLGYVALAMLSFAYRAARGRDGLGLGDAKLLAAAGAWVGWALLPLVVLIGAVLALGYISVLHLLGRSVSMDTRMPFGPFLSVGFYSCWIMQTMGVTPPAY